MFQIVAVALFPSIPMLLESSGGRLDSHPDGLKNWYYSRKLWMHQHHHLHYLRHQHDYHRGEWCFTAWHFREQLNWKAWRQRVLARMVMRGLVVMMTVTRRLIMKLWVWWWNGINLVFKKCVCPQFCVSLAFCGDLRQFSKTKFSSNVWPDAIGIKENTRVQLYSSRQNEVTHQQR